MPKVEEWCDSISQHTPELGGLDNDCDDDRLEVMEGSRRETRESQEGDDNLEYRHEAVEETSLTIPLATVCGRDRRGVRVRLAKGRR